MRARLALQHVSGNADKVISNIRIDAPTQVQLRVKVAEVKRDALKRVGINWQNINSIALFGTGAILGGFAVRTISADRRRRLRRAAFQTSDNGLNTLIDFLATQSQATILAEPNLIAMSGETASFLAGGEIPLIVPQGGALVGTDHRAATSRSASASPSRRPSSATASTSRSRPRSASSRPPARSACRSTVDRRRHHPGDPHPQGLDHDRARQRPKLRHRRPAAVEPRSRTSSSSRGSATSRCSARCSSPDAYQRSETELVIIITPYFVEADQRQAAARRSPAACRRPTPTACVMQRFNHPTPPRRIAVGRETTAGRPDRRLQTGLGAAMRSVVVLLAVAGARGLRRTRSPSRPPSTRATIRCAPTPCWRVNFAPGARRPRRRAGQRAAARMVAAGRRAQRDEFVVVSGRLGRAGAAAARPARQPEPVGGRRALGQHVGRAGHGDGPQRRRHRALGVPARAQQLPELQPGHHRQLPTRR